MYGIITTDDGPLVDVEIIDPTANTTVLEALLDAAGEHRRSVATTTHHGRVGYRVPRDIAEKAGILSAPEPAPKKTAAKKAPAKTPTKPVEDAKVPAVEQAGAK